MADLQPPDDGISRDTMIAECAHANGEAAAQAHTAPSTLAHRADKIAQQYLNALEEDDL